MCRHTTDSTPELMPFFLSLNYSYVNGKLFNNQARYSSVNGQVLEQTGNEWGKKTLFQRKAWRNIGQHHFKKYNTSCVLEPRLKTLAQYCTVLMLASGTHWPNFTIMRKCVNWHMPGFSVSAYIHKISLPFACVQCISFAWDAFVIFIHTYMMLPPFFCIFIKILTTSDCNANQIIAKSIIFELFHYKPLKERKCCCFFVISYCVLQNYISHVSVY